MKALAIAGFISICAISAHAQDAQQVAQASQQGARQSTQTTTQTTQPPQDTAPVFELSAQYQFLRADARPSVPRFNANGGSVGFAVNFFDQLSGVLEFGAVTNNSISGTRLKNTWLTYLAGPRVSLVSRERRVIPSFEVLVGGATAFGSGPAGVRAVPVARNTTGFAMAAGFVLDIRLSRLVALRPIQADYLLTNINNSSIQNNFRYQGGFVFTLGTQE